MTRDLIEYWHRFKGGTLDRAALDSNTRGLRRRVLSTLREVASCAQLDIRGQASNILGYQSALFTFIRAEGVEPTNNAAERALRHGVQHRKLSLGTEAERGARFLERIVAAAETLRRRGEHLLPFLVAAVDARRRGRPAPSLLHDR
ncbi:MAG: transposase [Myxococcales bacterium]|nr:transposase [Myxococcales bacterium]